jgi:hypothetical protein
MTRFLRTEGGGQVNADRIDRIDRGRAILADGTSVKLVDDDVDLEDILAPVVASAPGYVRLRAWPEEGLPLLTERLPIVAWRLTRFMTWPVVPADNADDGQHAVLLPDGRVIVPFGDTFDNEEAWRSARERMIAPAEAESASCPRGERSWSRESTSTRLLRVDAEAALAEAAKQYADEH